MELDDPLVQQPGLKIFLMEDIPFGQFWAKTSKGIVPKRSTQGNALHMHLLDTY